MNQKVRSLLSNKCFACHGPDEEARESGLRLDTREGAIESAIDLDDPSESEILERIKSDDPDMLMPPPKHGTPLTITEREMLLTWIENGAPYARHWSYMKPTKTAVPSTVVAKNSNEIDQFVQARLASSNLTPALPADKATLIRRLALDLTGLPPTMEELESFTNDNSNEAYEKVVDQYLARPAYGERWASVWLDLARYADSAGFAEDRKRTIWAYRDYVIRSFNENKSFEEFTIEQIAGDLLPSPTRQQKIATAFHRNTLTNSEGGTSDEEFHSAAVVDRVNTTMAVWMGTTIACAQCHTHKYDPITQVEYFQLYDFFNQTADYDRPNETPVLEIFNDEVIEKRRSLEDEIAAKKLELASEPNKDTVARWFSDLKSKSAQAEPSAAEGQFVRIELPGKGKILSLAEVKVSIDVNGVLTNVAGKGKPSQSSTGFGGLAELAIDGNTDGDFEKKSTTHTNRQRKPWWELDLGSTQSVESISIWHRSDHGLQNRSDGFSVAVLDKARNVVFTKSFEKALPTEQVVGIQKIPSSVLSVLKHEGPLSESQESDILAYYKTMEQSRIGLEVSELETKLSKLKPTTTVPVMEAIGQDKQRTTKVQIRGSYLNTGETVSSGTPAVFHPLNVGKTIESESGKEAAGGAKPDRMDLAKWLVDENNPLTARVVVNRYWEQIFGIGIVETSEEFGAQGELPSHPQLLDWLASDLIEHGWDTRRLLKQIVMSKTYRQSSVATAESLEVDPNNRLLARGPRVRLTAEMIRDQALAVSGLLSKKMYGPPVQPPQPKVGLKPAFSGQTTDWTDSVGENRYRRGIYTEWRRSSPYPSMSTFDVNSREVCELRRSSTNTPLQALVTLNDPVYVEAAQALARRITSESNNKTAAEQAAFGLQLCLVRNPTAQEVDRVVGLFERTREHFEKNKESAKELAIDPLNPPAKDADLVELAAWTTVANVLFNLDEMLMKP
ncbi:MAG: DUF1553 domain-containing protein [Mariniblastus sp.]